MSPEPDYPRHALRAVHEALTDTPVVVIQGARQVGKSTLAALASGVSSDVTSLTLDDPTTLAFARSDPESFVLQAGSGRLLIDEAQRAPEIVLPIKAAVDRDRRPGRFLLTGSADLLQVKGVGDSLAGRAETVELLPLSQGELERRDSPEDFITWLLDKPSTPRLLSLDPGLVIRGGYPLAVRRTPRRAARWFAGYVERLADHDARELQRGGYPDHLRALLELIASSGQSELVLAKVARTLGIAENSVDAYVRLATTMRLVTPLPPWRRSPRGRVSQRSKIALNDTGLAAFLAKFTPALASSMGGREYYGSLAEQFVAGELRKQAAWTETPYELFHYRAHDGLEVDILAELADGRLVAIEVKSSRSPDAKAWFALERFRDRHPDRDITGVLLHGGEQSARLHGWLHILPIPILWQH